MRRGRERGRVFVVTARTWIEGDLLPDDHPPLIDDDDPGYVRQIMTSVRPDPSVSGVVVGPPLGLDWDEIVIEYGPLREATEARNFTIRYRSTA